MLDLILKLISFIFSSLLILVLTIIRPIKHIKFGIMRSERFGSLGMDAEIFLRKRQNGYDPDVCHIFISDKPCNRQLLLMLKRCLRVVESPLLHKLFSASRELWKKTPFFEGTAYIYGKDMHEIIVNGKPTLQFTAEEEKRGEAYLKTKGLKSGDWFVCVFARDSRYLDKTLPGTDWTYHNYRNADIDNCIPAIRYLIDQGGFVFRIGKNVAQPVNFKHPRFIDYSIGEQNDFLDIYLIAKCRFFVGNTAGPQDITYLFDRPTAGINWVPLDGCPLGKNSIYIPKKLRRVEDLSLIPLQIYIRVSAKNRAIIADSNKLFEAGYQYEENTPEEILEAVKEMHSRLNGTWNPTKEDEALLKKFFQIKPQDHFLLGVDTPICLQYLKNNKSVMLSYAGL